MQNLFNRQIDMLSRVLAFNQRHADLFPPNSLVATLFAIIGAALPDLSKAAGSQAASIALSREGSSSRGEARAEVLDCLDAICLTARSIARVDARVGSKFKMPRSISDRDLLGVARGIAENAEPMKDEFILHEMDPSFIDELNAAISRFEESIHDHLNAKDVQTSATDLIGETLQRALDAFYRLDGIVPNKARKNPAILREWETARKVVRARVASTPEGNTAAGSVPPATAGLAPPPADPPAAATQP